MKSQNRPATLRSPLHFQFKALSVSRMGSSKLGQRPFVEMPALRWFALAALILAGAASAYSQSTFTWDVVSDISAEAIAFGGGQFVAYGSTPDGSEQGTFASPTGAPGSWNWTGFGPDFGPPSGLTYANGLFVAAGYGIATSPDGTNWTTVYSQVSSPLSAVIYAHGLFVAVGGGNPDDSPNNAIILTSSDGAHWVPRGPSFSGGLESVAYGNGVFVTVGFRWFTFDGGPAEGYAVLTSPDGITWTLRGNSIGPTLNAVGFGNGLFVEIAGNGIVTSANGTFSLTAPDYIGSGDFAGATYGDGWFVAVGSSIVVSSNGRAWSSSSYDLPSTASFNSVTFLNGVFMAASDAGIVRGSLGATSPTAPPAILTAPQDQSVDAGDSATFSVTASGTSPLRYQWQFNGTNLSGQTNATLTISYALPDNAGNYTVVVSNAHGAVTSSPPAELDVQYSDYPTILEEPPATRTLQVGGAVEFDVLAVGDIPLTYQWRFNGTDLPGETSTALVLSNVNQLQAGSYAVIVSNDAGAVTSDGTFLTVSTLPQTISTEYWPMYDGDVKYYSGVAGSSSIQTIADPNQGDFRVKVYLGDTNGSPDEVFGVGYGVDDKTVLDYSAKPQIGATFDFNPPWAWFDDHQLQDGGTISSSFVASVPNYTNINTAGSVTITQAGTVTVPAGTFYNCKLVSTAGHGAVIAGFNQAMVLAPEVGPIKLGLYLPTPSGGTRFVGWESLTGGNIGGVAVALLASRDTKPPTVIVTSPKSGQAVSNAAFIITGTANDNVAVSDVYYQLNSSGWKPAESSNFFSNWTASVTLIPGTNALQAYAVDTSGNLSATSAVTFTYNRYLMAQGAYNGLFAVSDTARENDNSGGFTFNLTSAGKFTGKLLLGADSLALNGAFDVDGSAQVILSRKSKHSLTVSLQLDFADQTVSGSVTDGNFVAELIGYQNVFSSKHPASTYAGQYTLVIPGTNDPATGPYGSSYGTVKVDALGNITFAGSLSDGTAVSQSGAISQNGYWPLYLQLYGGTGSLWSWNCLTNGTIASESFVSWINTTNSTKTALYRSGFTNQNAAIVGSYYNPSASPLLGFTAGATILEGGGLPSAITNEVTLSSGGAVTITPAANTNKLALTINKTTGVISGAFANPSNAKLVMKVNGVVLQSQTNCAGYFLGGNQSGTFLLADP